MPRTTSQAVIFLLVLCVAGSASAETYKWVDAQGQIHYSDRPPPDGAEKVELIPAQAYHAPAAAQATSNAKTERPKGSTVAYSEFEVRKPQNGEVVTNSGGNVSVQLRMDPALQPGHSIWLYLDGKRLDGLSTTSTAFQLSNVVRGDHTLVAAVVEPSGKAVVSAPAIQFTIRQNSVAKPPVGPTLRPKPPAGT